jgi:class 3 adenylate cyclase
VLERAQRRLAAILSADVVGYSRLIGQDEAGTLRHLKELRRNIVNPIIKDHHGRVVKTTGDGILIEFPSAVEAVRCAVRVQRATGEAEVKIPPDRRIAFRVGVHQGDVVVENNDLFGDGVNVAARLEGLSEAGGVCVSGRVYEDTVGRLDLPFEDRGDQQSKTSRDPSACTLWEEMLFPTFPRYHTLTKPRVPQASSVSSGRRQSLRDGPVHCSRCLLWLALRFGRAWVDTVFLAKPVVPVTLVKLRPNQEVQRLPFSLSTTCRVTRAKNFSQTASATNSSRT